MANSKILIVFYSMYGHVYELINNVCEGINEAGGETIIKKVEDLIPEKYLDEHAVKLKV